MHTNIISKAYARILDARIRKYQLDAIIAPAGSAEIAHLRTAVPVVYTTDATFSLLDGYYANFSQYGEKVRAEINEIEHMALTKAAHISYPSEWAKTSCQRDYNISPEKISVISYGANIEPMFPNVQPKSLEGPVNLLFLGIDWQRKGGEVAHKVFLELYSKNSNTRFIICGCHPDIETHPNIEIVPFLDKNKDSDTQKFKEILSKSHFLILPTQKECFGIVFIEASAYGIPSFALDTGGVSGAIKEGVNGHLFDEHRITERMSSKIEYYISHPHEYHKLSESCIEYYNKEANWDIWAQKLLQTIKGIIDTRES